MSSGQPTDEQLYERRFSAESLRERQAAWEELERRYRGNLLAYCCRITGNAALAEDCAAEALLAVLGRRQAVGTSFRAYLWATARNLARRTLKSHPQPGSPARDCADPLSEVISAEERAAVERCLGQLRSDQREFVRLHVCDGLTLKQAAGAVGWKVSVSTCKYRLDNSLGELRASLRKFGIRFEKIAPSPLSYSPEHSGSSGHNEASIRRAGRDLYASTDPLKTCMTAGCQGGSPVLR